MKRTVKTTLAATSLMLALSVPVFAENASATTAGTGTAAGTAYTRNYDATGAGTTGTGMFGTRGTTGTGVTGTGTGNTGTGIGNMFGMNNNDDNNIRTRSDYRRHGVTDGGVGNRTMTANRVRAANTADNRMDWGWLGLLGLIGLAGLRNRGRETT